MTQLTVLLHRLGAFAANIAQMFLQNYGGGNGDPQVFDETAKRDRDSDPETGPKARGN
ncbi:hypothetical protein [Salinibacterium sp. SWN248]|uniref:hypothetical protein n=1 Tax=Salinibacterium sp. SWN248 TaxID=2792056 RepID=UPI0018CEE05E|nr:hypothetical protein [Salinibacterium sp. SWN248]MBH0022863.1 hypothetical protein [Salinibacterium sp. SWN248]